MHGGRSLMSLPRILRLAFSGLRTFFTKGRFSFKCPDLRTFFRRISAFRALQHPPGSSDSVEFAVRCPSWLHQSQVLQGCWSERLRCLNASSSACAAKAPPFKICKMTIRSVSGALYREPNVRVLTCLELSWTVFGRRSKIIRQKHPALHRCPWSRFEEAFTC